MSSSATPLPASPASPPESTRPSLEAVPLVPVSNTTTLVANDITLLLDDRKALESGADSTGDKDTDAPHRTRLLRDVLGDDKSKKCQFDDNDDDLDDGAPIQELHPNDLAHAPVDGGRYAWLAVLASFLIHFASFGHQYAFGLYQKQYQTVDFPHAAPSSISLIGTVGPCVMFVTGTLVGRLAERVPFQAVIFAGSILLPAGFILASFATEVWQLVLTQGIVYGLGSALTYFPGVSLPAQWWVKRRSFAVGIAVSGTGFGGIAVTQVVGALLPRVGTAWTLRICGFGSLALLLMASAMVRTRLPPTAHQAGQTRPPLLDWTRFRDARFVALMVVTVGFPFGYMVPFFSLPTYLSSVAHQSPTFTATLLTVINVLSIVGRVGTGWVADRVGNINTYMISLVVTGAGTLAFWLPAGGNTALLFIYAVVFGLSAGGFIGLNATVIAQLFGIEELPSMLGMLYTGTAAGNLAGPPIAAALITACTSASGIYSTPAREYVGAIVFAALTMLFGAAGSVYLRFALLDRRVRVKV
ncbi:hypothetical protein GGF32_006428 [Allomyces javanicus]|nr:hypothetical protein GGF32_006428 [Allomyces javanicus]